MSKKGAATSKGKKVAVFPTDDVCVVFHEVTRSGLTTIAKPRTGPEPPRRRRIRQYYQIKTTAEHSPPVEIRIILSRVPAKRAHMRMWRWYKQTREWKDVTKSFSQKFHLLVGETRDCLESMFGVT